MITKEETELTELFLELTKKTELKSFAEKYAGQEYFLSDNSSGIIVGYDIYKNKLLVGVPSWSEGRMPFDFFLDKYSNSKYVFSTTDYKYIDWYIWAEDLNLDWVV